MNKYLKSLVWLTVTLVVVLGLVFIKVQLNKYESVSYIEGKTVSLGRTSAEVNQAYADCLDMAERTEQSSDICEPKEAVFGDFPQESYKISDFIVDKFETNLQGFPVKMSFSEAKAYCETRGGFLPSREQYAYLISNGGVTKWPWGNEKPNLSLVNLDVEGGNAYKEKNPFKVGSFPSSLWGLYDLVGNIAEWIDEELVMGGNSGTYTTFSERYQVTNSSTGWAGVRCVYVPTKWDLFLHFISFL